MSKDLAMRDMEAAIEEISACRLEAAQYRQLGMFDAYVTELLRNAKGAERWLLKAGKAYPRRCDSAGNAVG